jgi:hypothetical protein
MSDDKLSPDELKRILLEKRPKEFPGRITAESGISRDIYEQARAAGLIDENGHETF